MNTGKNTDDFWGDPIYTYTAEEAVEDGILMENTRKDRFGECSHMTCNLYEQIDKLAQERNKTRLMEIDAQFLVGCVMIGAREQYQSEAFKGDNDKNFFVIEGTEDGFSPIWFVRNEYGKLTAMLPEDY